ncbi:MAG: hypothetical protein PVI71_09020 [Desulfobacterales bacterium]|jgi:colicin import membrane protein
MESNQMTCPQCGLANHYLAESCAQCGIIFVKNHAMQMQNDRDEQKRKAIEDAEAILAQSDPAAGNDRANNEAVVRPDPAEDTIEMAIPVEHQASETPPEAASTDEKRPEENQEPTTNEIELEAIETSIEMVTTTADAEELFLSEVKPDKPAEQSKPDTIQKPNDSPAHSETAAQEADKTVKSDAVEEETKDTKKDHAALKQSEAKPTSANLPEEDHKKKKSEQAQSEVAEPDKAETAELAKAKTPAAEVAEAASNEDEQTLTAQPAEKEIHLEDKSELTMVKDEPVQDKVAAHPDATIEMPKEPATENVPTKKQEAEAQEEAVKRQQEAQVREALKKQREDKAKADALKKEKAAKAKAAALKKKKLAKVKAEALKKQKTAQAKAEALKKKEAQAKSTQKQKTARAQALKKQKEAQAKAEASAQEIQIAGSGVFEPGSQAAEADLNRHAKLLGLLKRYKGKAIGINYDNSSEIKEAELVDANEEFFSVMVKDKKLQYSYPLKNILTIVEGQEGVETGEDNKKLKFDAVIKVYPLVPF